MTLVPIDMTANVYQDKKDPDGPPMIGMFIRGMPYDLIQGALDTLGPVMSDAIKKYLAENGVEWVQGPTSGDRQQ